MASEMVSHSSSEGVAHKWLHRPHRPHCLRKTPAVFVPAGPAGPAAGDRKPRAVEPRSDASRTPMLLTQKGSGSPKPPSRSTASKQSTPADQARSIDSLLPGASITSVPAPPLTVVAAPKPATVKLGEALRSQLGCVNVGEREQKSGEAMLEMSSCDNLCVRTISVSYTDLSGKRRKCDQAGYNVRIILPSSALDVEVEFSSVGGSAVRKVDRSQPDLPWVHSESDGAAELEVFHYPVCPEYVQYFLRGSSQTCWVAHVDQRERSESLFELASRDFKCLRVLNVEYTDASGARQKWSGSGYTVKCHIPSVSRNVEVTFSAVGGSNVRKIDRRDPDMPWVKDANGIRPVEKFFYAECPTSVQYEIRGPSLHAFISSVRVQKAHKGSNSAIPSTGSCGGLRSGGDARELFEVAPDEVPSIGGIVELEEKHSEYLLPQEVVLFEPSKQEVFAKGDDSKPGTRLLFLNTKLSDQETAALRELRQLLAKRGVIASETAELPRFMAPHALRLLQTAKYNVSKAADMMKICGKERLRRLPIAEADVINDLHSGFIYWHGRDRLCRPVLVIRLERLGEMAKDKERAVRTVIFTLEYALRFAMVPGRVENWVVIIDLENVTNIISPLSIGSMISTASAIGTTLEKVYCGRMVWIKIVNMPGGNGMLGRAINGVIPAEKKDKVSFPQDISGELLRHIEPNQLEARYGGLNPDLQPGETYPFKFFANPRGEAGRPHRHDADNDKNDQEAEGEGARGEKSPESVEPEDFSLHESARLAFHAGALWDASSQESTDRWLAVAKQSSLAPHSAAALSDFGVEIEPCRDIDRWLEIVNPRAVDHQLTRRLDNENDLGGGPSSRLAAESPEAPADAAAEADDLVVGLRRDECIIVHV